MTALDLVRAAEALSCGDEPEAALCWLLNRIPPASRAHAYVRTVDTIHSLSLSDSLKGPLCPPRLFDYEAAEATWSGLIASSGMNDRNTEVAAQFFKADPNAFAPHVFPARWASQAWTTPLTPAQMRSMLMMSADDTRAVVEAAGALLESARPLQAILKLHGYSQEQLAAAKLRIAVMPYADTLVFSALLYAVSDLVEGMSFLPASFYRVKGTGARSVPIESGVCNAGYTTRYQFARINSLVPASLHQIFNEGLTRSIVLRLRKDPRRLPQVSHLSLLGQFGPQGNCITDPTYTENGIARITVDDDFAIAEDVDPIINWEQALLLSFAGKQNDLQSSGEARNDGLGLSLSTDAHLWASHFHLFRPGEVREADSQGVDDGFGPLVRAAWNPAKQRGAPLEDVEAELCWFMPSLENPHKSVRLARTLADIADRVFLHTIEHALEILHEQSNAPADAVDSARKALNRVARALLSPLFLTMPEYRGAMLDSPPECWLAKVVGPADHLRYRPRWHQRLTAQSRESLPENVIRVLKLAS